MTKSTLTAGGVFIVVLLLVGFNFGVGDMEHLVMETSDVSVYLFYNASSGVVEEYDDPYGTWVSNYAVTGVRIDNQSGQEVKVVFRGTKVLNEIPFETDIFAPEGETSWEFLEPMLYPDSLIVSIVKKYEK